MATFYEWCIEEWTGHPDAEDSDSIDPAFTDRLDDAIRRVPEALRDAVLEGKDAIDGRGVYWSLSLWRATGDDIDGLRDRWYAYVPDIRAGVFPGGIAIPKRYVSEYRSALPA